MTGEVLLGWTTVTARPRPRAVLLALGAVLVTVLGACTSGSTDGSATTAATASSTPTEAPVTPVAWDDCTAQIAPIIAGRPGADRPLAFGCGQIEVPLSHEDPTGPTLSLFAVRAVSGTQVDRIGSLVVNPGGPGLSATDAAVQAALTLPDGVLARFDVVGVDPRGVGLSQPVSCISDTQKDQLAAADPRVSTPEQQDSTFALLDEVAAECVQEYGEGLGAFSTVDSARDLDIIREALGDEQLSYLGYSYGTTLGSTYAELFPDKVRALVLDGAVDPDADRQAVAESQAAGFEAAYDAFSANCTGLVSGCPLGADPRAFLQTLLTQAAATPIPTSRAGDTRQATPGLILAAVRSALYSPGSWPQLAQSLAAASAGDAAGVLTLADTFTGRSEDGSYTNVIDANITISCSDSEETVSRDDVRALVAAWGASYPLFGADAATGVVRLHPVGRPADPVAGTRCRRCRPDPRHRHPGRPGHPAAGRGGHGHRPHLRGAADLAGLGAHCLPQDGVRHDRGQLLPGRPGRPDRRAHLPGLIPTGAPAWPAARTPWCWTWRAGKSGSPPRRSRTSRTGASARSTSWSTSWPSVTASWPRCRTGRPRWNAGPAGCSRAPGCPPGPTPAGDAFYQKRVPKNAPDYVRTARVTFPSGRTADEVAPDSLAVVAWAVNLGTLTFHPWPVRIPELDRPDQLRIDLDPQPGTDFSDAAWLAPHVQELLGELGLVGWPKTSGGRGLHVYVPIEPRWTFVEARRAVIAFGRELARRFPDRVTV